MIASEQNDRFSPEAERSIKDLIRLMDRTRDIYRGPGDPALSLPGAFTADEVLLFHAAVVTLFAETDLTYVLVESGIPLGTSFTDETMRLIKSRILPYVYDERDLRLVIGQVFHRSDDGLIFARLAETFGTRWIEANASLLVPDSAILQNQLENAAKIISYRIAAIGMEEEMAVRAGKEESLITPFLEQNLEINALLQSVSAGDRTKAAEDYAQAVIMLRQCRGNIRRLDKASAENGASMQQTFILNKSTLLIDRLITILALIHEIEEQVKINGFFALIQDIILCETNPKKLRNFFARNTQMIAYRITENKRKTGEHYITSGQKEYFDMFVSACGGGFIVSFLVIIKLVVHHAELPPLWEGLLFSINYATGFCMIHVLNFTLATKQPAMTAAYIAASLDTAEPGDDEYRNFASMIAAVSRSQMVSFAGNLLVVFPFSLMWIFFVRAFSGEHFLNDTTARAMLTSVHPVFSLSILYAALAGFFLFLAGLISGFGDNKVVVSRIGVRLQYHPWLSRHISPERLQRIASYTERNLGPLVGNIAVGFMLGMTAFFGHITGLPLDIRHVTFSGGNLALGLLGTHFHVTFMDMVACLSGLALIGMVNFLVSFSCALQVALRSRGLRLRNYPDLLKSVLVYFRHHPGEFFYPPKAKAETDPIPEAHA